MSVRFQDDKDTYTGNILQIYLREMGQTKLLTPAEEIALAARIKNGDMNAREHMIKANLRLVVNIARDYEGYGLPLLDLINEGNIGLMKGVKKFDPAKGGKLSTYSGWWIKQHIKRALANQSRNIRLPVHIVDKVSHMRRAELKLTEEFGREPTDDELAEELGMSADRVGHLRTISIRPASIDMYTDEESSTTIGDVLFDKDAPTPYQELEEKTQVELLQMFIGHLDPREIQVLRYRFGLDGGPEKTLEEVGQKFRITRERIRQIQNKALKKLKKKILFFEATGKTKKAA